MSFGEDLLESARRADTRREVLSDVDPVVLEAWRLQGRKVGAMLAEAQAAVIEAHDALRDIADDYEERFDLNSPSTNPGIKSVIKQARAVLRGDGVDACRHPFCPAGRGEGIDTPCLDCPRRKAGVEGRKP
jgi:hypothetical protein